jgi:hypothetical protein
MRALDLSFLSFYATVRIVTLSNALALLAAR